MRKITEKLKWDDKYIVGVAEIDKQHKKIFKTFNKLSEIIDEGLTEKGLEKIIRGVHDYKDKHFATEEKYFKKFKYDDRDNHIAKHREFINKFNYIIKTCAGDNIRMAFELIDFLGDWLIEHIIYVDQKYKKCFKEHGLK